MNQVFSIKQKNTSKLTLSEALLEVFWEKKKQEICTSCWYFIGLKKMYCAPETFPYVSIQNLHRLCWVYYTLYSLDHTLFFGPSKYFFALLLAFISQRLWPVLLPHAHLVEKECYSSFGPQEVCMWIISVKIYVDPWSWFCSCSSLDGTALFH